MTESAISNKTFFESWDGINKLIDFLITARLPSEQTLYFNNEEMKGIDDFLKNLGSSGVTSVPLKGTAIGCNRLTYRGYNFNLVNIDKVELVMNDMKIEKGDLMTFRYINNIESVDKTFFIKEVGISEFIGVELGSSDKIRFMFYKRATNNLNTLITAK